MMKNIETKRFIIHYKPYDSLSNQFSHSDQYKTDWFI